jgi:phosphatidylinositol alpha-mannosyltransferase
VKIAQVSPYDVRHPGGVPKHIDHLKIEFERHGHEVVVLAPRSSKGGVEIEPGFYGIGRTFEVPGNGSRVRLTFDVTLYNAVKQLLSKEQFDIVHLHEPLIPVLPHMVLLNSKTVNVATFHAARVSNPWYSAFRPYFSMSQYFEGPYNIIPNGIDCERYNEGVKPFPWAHDGAQRILFVGRYNESRKGFQYLLRALPMVQQQFPNLRLMVVGPGEPEKFEGMMERNRIQGVDFVGQASVEDLPRYYASCDVFCAPAIKGESFGMVLLEAMASGKPVVATDIPGYASVLTHERQGILVEPQNSASLALGLVRVLADRELRARFEEIGPVTAAKYAWPHVARGVLDVYGRATEAANARLREMR